MIYQVEMIKTNAHDASCDMCALLLRTVNRSGDTEASNLHIDRVGSFLKLKSNGPLVLSIVCPPEQDLSRASDMQLGFVGLPEAGEATHLAIIRYWLRDCDSNHACQPSEYVNGANNESTFRLPTRLIDVGEKDDINVRLWITAPENTGKWIALSHKWGSHHFATTPDNLQRHLDGIKVTDLPHTFRDAVTVTRALGLRYLWIDSLCVIQGPEGDFKHEAKRMEDVYSGAYCVIAASCASDHYDGFLKTRNTRDYVKICQEGKGQTPFYICQTIDNFKEHVLDGELHSRGWVLQEHALARRTLFFTKHQTYFECGNGVHCETSTRMQK
jgi:hypothetical protein